MTDFHPIIRGYHFEPPVVPKGRPKDSRFDELDTLAARDILNGKFASERKAAIAFLHLYDGAKSNSYTTANRYERLRDITNRLKAKLVEIQTSE